MATARKPAHLGVAFRLGHRLGGAPKNPQRDSSFDGRERAPKPVDSAVGKQQPRRVGLGAVLIVAMVACTVLWALVLRFLLGLWF